MSEPLDLDRAEADFFVESSEDSCRCPHDHERARALIAELRRLREENARLEKLLLDWRHEYGNGSIEREASRIATRRAGRAS